ncbi:MAG TPA: nucleotidyltransferase family protein [Hyphomicrobiaceae bacterium]|jgi:MurNAc alpha-1-phosphate uridylyltransferase
MTWIPKSAMVLAAGLGSRMRPLTDLVPKPLVRLRQKPLIDYALDRIAEAGISQAVVNVHHFADQVISHLKTRQRPRILISDEREQLLDTGGGVKKALPQLGQEPFLIHNSDSVWIDGVQSDLVRLAQSFDAERMDCLLLLALSSASIGYDGRGDFLMSPDGLLQRRPERELAPFVFTGVSIAHPRLFDGAPEGAFSLNQLWDRAIQQRRLYGIRLDGTWMHVGTPAALAEAEQALGGSYAA